MMKSSRLEEDENIEDSIIKDASNLFRLKNLKKEVNDAANKDKTIFFEHGEEDYYKPVRLKKF